MVTSITILYHGPESGRNIIIYLFIYLFFFFFGGGGGGGGGGGDYGVNSSSFMGNCSWGKMGLNNGHSKTITLLYFLLWVGPSSDNRLVLAIIFSLLLEPVQLI